MNPEEENQDEEIGELIERPYLTADEIEIIVGDSVQFSLRHPAVEGRVVRSLGQVREIWPGYELNFVVWVYSRPGGAKWAPQVVARRDIVRVRPTLRELLSCL